MVSFDILVAVCLGYVAFLFLVALAAIPAFIAAWYFMSQWLDTFHYHAAMNWWLHCWVS